MKLHVFLTGHKGAGKSTIIRRLLEEYKETAGGFLTVKTDEVYKGRYSVHLLSVADGEKPSEDNLLFFCDALNVIDKARCFNSLGCNALETGSNAGLIVMDELGPNEGNAIDFRQAVMAALDGDVPVIGVLQKAESEFLRDVKAHPKVQVIEVTRENREEVLERLKNNWRE